MTRHSSRWYAPLRLGRITAAALSLQLVAVAGPASAKDLIDTLAGMRSFSTLLCVLEVAGLEERLRGPGPFTLFAPTNEAFAALPPGALEALERPENRPQLAETMSRYVLPERLMARDRAGRRGLAVTLAGSLLMVDGTSGMLMVDGGVEVLQADIVADNGVIHIIDSLAENAAGHAFNDSAF